MTASMSDFVLRAAAEVMRACFASAFSLRAAGSGILGRGGFSNPLALRRFWGKILLNSEGIPKP